MQDKSHKGVQHYNHQDTAFAFFMVFNYMLSLFMNDYVEGSRSSYLSSVIGIKAIGILLCVSLLLKAHWPTWLTSYFRIYWKFILLYCIPFSYTFLLLVNNGSHPWMVHIALGLTLLIVLVDWISFLVISALGIVLALFCYLSFIGKYPILNTNSLYILIYTILSSVSIGLIFARRKEQSFNSLLLQKEQLNEIQQVIRKELASNLTYYKELLKDLQPDKVAFFDEVTSNYIQEVTYRITSYLQLDVSWVVLNKLKKYLIDLYSGLQVDQPNLVFKQYSNQHSIEADATQLKQLLVNAIDYVHLHNTNHNPITILLEDTQLGHSVAHMPNYVRMLDAIKITITSATPWPQVQSLYKLDPMGTNTWSPVEDKELPLVENARIIDAHYGYMAEKSTHTQGYVLPVKLREIRGKVMELIKSPATVDPEELKHPLALKVEKELFQKLEHTQIDKTIVQKAVDLIKRYHAGVKRKSGEPFFTHPIEVALIVLEYWQDQQAVLAALLHDTVEDTSLSMKDIERLFGEKVAFLVGKATNLEDHKRRISLGDRENLVRILNYEDPRAALVKLADRLHNMRTIQYHTSADKKRRIAQETFDEFVPLAKKLNLVKIADELEKLSQLVLNK